MAERNWRRFSNADTTVAFDRGSKGALFGSAWVAGEEIESGVVVVGAAAPNERHSIEALVAQLNEAHRQSPQE